MALGRKTPVRWDTFTHESSRRYRFRLRYVMAPLHAIVILILGKRAGSGQTYVRERDEVLERHTAGATVLDVGCGDGERLRELREKHGCRPMGVDVSAGILRDAKSQYGDVDFVAGDVLQLPFRDASFDVVHSSMLFHHLPVKVRDAALREMARVARRFVVVEDLFGFPRGLMALLHRAYYSIADGSYYRYALDEWRVALREHIVVDQVHTDEDNIRARVVTFVIPAGQIRQV